MGDLPRVKRRRLLLGAMLRALAIAAGLVVLYYLLPLDHLSRGGRALLLTVGLLGVAAIIGLEVKAILKAEYPVVQAIEALAISAPLFLLLFATAYFLMGHTTPTSFTQPLSRTDALYFTITTFTTVGYGDITPVAEGARAVVMFQMIADLVLIGFGDQGPARGGADGPATRRRERGRSPGLVGPDHVPSRPAQRPGLVTTPVPTVGHAARGAFPPPCVTAPDGQAAGAPDSVRGVPGLRDWRPLLLHPGDDGSLATDLAAP